MSQSYHLGANTHRVPMAMHKEHRDKLVARFSDAPSSGVLLFKGGEIINRYDTDVELHFRQESFFLYLFGTHHPGCYGAIELGTGRSVLFIPRLPAEYAVWMGTIHPPSHYATTLGLDEARYVDEIPQYMKELSPATIYTLKGVNTDSGSVSEEAQFEGITQYHVDSTRLHGEVVECRVTKSRHEMELLRWVNKISSEAHIEVMRRVRPDMMEYQLESIYLHECYSKGGARFMAYTCICGAGQSGATLHYGQNDKRVEDGHMCLLDMGCEYHCYASDITCSFPANGKFTDKQKTIYNAVLRANRAVLSTVKAGVSWPAMHRLAERVLLEGLVEAGILVGSIEDLEANFIANLFQPHGLGHLIGLDVHDVGGYPHGMKRSTEPGLSSLRCGRVLEAGMFVTIEPGCYFIPPLLLPALDDPAKGRFFNRDVLMQYMDFGGVRIEDDVLIHADHAELLTQVPRTVDEIEAVMAEGRKQYP